MTRRPWNHWWLLTADPKAERVHCETHRGVVSEAEFELEYPGELAKFKEHHVKANALQTAVNPDAGNSVS